MIKRALRPRWIPFTAFCLIRKTSLFVCFIRLLTRMSNRPVISKAMFLVSGKTAANIRTPRFGLLSDFWPVMKTTGARKRCLPSIPRCGMRMRRLRKNTKSSRMCWLATSIRIRSMRDAAAGAGIPVLPHGIARRPWRSSAVIWRKAADFRFLLIFRSASAASSCRFPAGTAAITSRSPCRTRTSSSSTACRLRTSFHTASSLTDCATRSF